jgi:hypothetical protein
MKTVFEASTREELTKRINSITDNNKALWGKMNAYQMVKHCALCDDMYHGKIPMKRVFIGYLIGKMILKKSLKDEAPFAKNSPTSPLLYTNKASGEMEEQKKVWLSSIERYANYQDINFVHPFFGPMTREQIGLFVYKHADHHLRQFGA